MYLIQNVISVSSNMKILIAACIFNAHLKHPVQHLYFEAHIECACVCMDEHSQMK